MDEGLERSFQYWQTAQAALCRVEEDSELEMLTTLPQNTRQPGTRLYLHYCRSVQALRRCRARELQLNESSTCQGNKHN